MATIMIAVENLRPTPDEENPNEMTDEEQQLLNASWAANVDLQPLLITPRFMPGDGYTHTVVDGEHRRRAAIANGDTHVEAKVGVYNDTQIKLLRIAMNKNRGVSNMDVVKAHIRDLIEDGFKLHELTLTGFNESELDEMVNELAAEPLVGNIDTTPPLVADKPHVLEIAFANVAQLKLARRALSKAAGATGDIGLGLLNLIGVDDA